MTADAFGMSSPSGINASKLDGVSGTCTRIAVGDAPAEWHRYESARHADPVFTASEATLANDPMLLYFTSGTTAKPKLVVHTHQSYPIGHLSTVYWIGLQPGDRHWNISSPGWAKHAYSSFFAPWNAEATVFIFNYERFDAKAVLGALERHQVTTLCAPPTVWRMLIQESLGTYRVALREALSAGEPLNPEVIEQVQSAWGVTIRDGYGQTETTLQVGNSPGQPMKIGSMGRPMPGYDVVLLDADGQVSETEGEICLRLENRPLGLTDGYADDDVKTSNVMRDGYYHTGDIATRDSDGYLTFVGRADDVFKASDYRLSPFELESVLIECPAVAEAAVVPSPDPVRHAVPKAFVTLAAGFSPSREVAAEILAHCRARLAPYKRIRRIEFAMLPKTISGKIRRVELRQMEADRRAAGQRATHEFFEEDYEQQQTRHSGRARGAWRRRRRDDGAAEAGIAADRTRRAGRSAGHRPAAGRLRRPRHTVQRHRSERLDRGVDSHRRNAAAPGRDPDDLGALADTGSVARDGERDAADEL